MGVKLVSASAGSVELVAPATASNYTATMPAGTGTVVVNGVSGSIVSGTTVSASGTSVSFTSIPSWVKRITVAFVDLSSNGTSTFIVQLGDSGGLEDTSYTSTLVAVAASTNGTAYTNGFGISASAAASAYSGQAIISLQNASTNTWTYTSTSTSGSTTLQIGGGAKALSSTLTQLSITTVGGANTFDAGTINILYE